MNKRYIGIYDPYLESRGGGEKVCLALAEVLAENPDSEVVLVAHEQVELSGLEEYFDLDLSKISLEVISLQSLWVKIALHLPAPSSFRFFLKDLYLLRALKKKRYDVFINNCYQSNLPNVGRYGVYMCMFPQRLHTSAKDKGFIKATYRNILAWFYRLTMYPTKKHGVFTYDLITANSEYTRHYIKEYWNLDSKVLYPICEDMSLGKTKKAKVILNVGRFFAFDTSSHHKRQDALLEAFSAMDDLHKDGWELHFAGSLENDKNDKAYTKSLERSSENLPVYYHFNCSFEELRKLYNQASIYWHATGFGSNQDDFPEKQEHFGISTVEAMSTGTVPIVINSAGQREIVKQGKNGMLWESVAELQKLTRNVIASNPTEKSKVISEAQKTAAGFNKDAFRKSVLHIFDEAISHSNRTSADLNHR